MTCALYARVSTFIKEFAFCEILKRHDFQIIEVRDWGTPGLLKQLLERTDNLKIHIACLGIALLMPEIIAPLWVGGKTESLKCSRCGKTQKHHIQESQAASPDVIELERVYKL